MTNETLLEKLMRDGSAYVNYHDYPRWIIMTKKEYRLTNGTEFIKSYRLTCSSFYEMCQDLGIDK